MRHDALTGENAAALRIQRHVSSRRLRRAADILARVPPEIKQLIVCKIMEPDAVALSLDVCMSRLVRASFEQCGIGSGGRDSGTSGMAFVHGDDVRSDTEQELFFQKLSHAFELATVHHDEISREHLQEYLEAALELDTQYGADANFGVARFAMLAFARCVLESHLESADPGVARSPWMNQAGRRVLEAAVVCAGA